MANEILKRDSNHITVAGGVTDDANEEVRMFRVDPTTKRLKVSAILAGGNGITELNGLTASVQTFSVDDDTNVTLTITSAVDDHEFALGWTGNLAVGRGGTGLTTIAAGSVLAANSLDTLSAVTSTSGTKVLTNTSGTVSWETQAGGGNVSNTGTPLNNQVAIWTDATTIEGDSALTFDTSTDTLAGFSILTGAAAGFTLNTATNGDITLDPGGSGTLTLNAGSGGVDITTDAGNSNITLTPHGSGINVLSNAQVSSLTASEIVITDASKNLVSAAVATYPSLTELTYLKGVTSSIQTQLNGKQASGSYAVTALSNLASVAINTSLISDTDSTDDLGSSSIAWANLYVDTIELGHATENSLTASSGILSIEGVAIPTISNTATLTNKRITKRTGTTTSSATPTINTDNVDFYSLTAQAEDITSFTTNLSGTPTEAQTLWIAITGTAARAITWGASFEASTVALPTTTVTTARLDVGFVWNSITSKWRCVATC